MFPFLHSYNNCRSKNWVFNGDTLFRNCLSPLFCIILIPSPNRTFTSQRSFTFEPYIWDKSSITYLYSQRHKYKCTCLKQSVSMYHHANMAKNRKRSPLVSHTEMRRNQWDTCTRMMVDLARCPLHYTDHRFGISVVGQSDMGSNVDNIRPQK
jgi:hypothetical protein